MNLYTLYNKPSELYNYGNKQMISMLIDMLHINNELSEHDITQTEHMLGKLKSSHTKEFEATVKKLIQTDMVTAFEDYPTDIFSDDDWIDFYQKEKYSYDFKMKELKRIEQITYNRITDVIDEYKKEEHEAGSYHNNDGNYY